jgi:hypothetical protein
LTEDYPEGKERNRKIIIVTHVVKFGDLIHNVKKYRQLKEDINKQDQRKYSRLRMAMTMNRITNLTLSPRTGRTSSLLGEVELESYRRLKTVKTIKKRRRRVEVLQKNDFTGNNHVMAII